MNSTIEFHDSEVSSVRAVADSLRLELSAYIHRSSGQPGIAAGSVFLQPAAVVFSGAVHEETGGSCVGPIADASIAVDSSQFANVVPVPFAARGTVSAAFTFTSGAVLLVKGTGVTCEVSGEPVFVEEYDG